MVYGDRELGELGGFHELEATEFLEPVEAFARGVNCGRVAGGARKAHEFTLLGAKPTEFTSLDTSAILSLLSFLLAANKFCP